MRINDLYNRSPERRVTVVGIHRKSDLQKNTCKIKLKFVKKKKVQKKATRKIGMSIHN